MDKFFYRFVFSDQRSYRLGRHISFWMAAWLFQGFIYGFMYTTDLQRTFFLLSYGESLIFLPQHMMLSYSIIYVVLPRFLFKGKYGWGIFCILLLIVITAVMSPLMQKTIIHSYRDWIGFPWYSRNLFVSFMGGLRGGLTVAGFAVAIKLLKHWYIKNTENQRLEKEKLKAELELLKGQLHPHFMFNTLNSIYSMALKDSSQSAEAILKLANLMRYLMAESKQNLVSLSEELIILNNYIEMEKNRFGERLHLMVNIHGDMEDKAIPPLLLLPFVENSFKHGTSQVEGQAWMSMDIQVKNDQLAFKLVNGKPQEPKRAKILSSGIGLKNVKRRLALLYPHGYDLRITEDETTFIVSMILPLNKINVAG
jgi:sensor histidine kinase YesM